MIKQAAPPHELSSSTPGVLGVRVALLSNILLGHNVAVLEALRTRVQSLRVLLSAENEPDRKNPVRWGGLDVQVQKAWRRTQSFRNTFGYQDVTHLQIPYDTLPQLWRYRPDVVISGQFGGRTLQAALYKVLHPRTLFIVWATLSQRTEATRGGLRLRLRRWILKRADACFTHGIDGESYLRGLGFRKPVFWTPYAIESEVFSGENRPPDDGCVHLLYTGQLIERKGIVPFVEALCAWCRAHPAQRVHLLVGGDGPQRTDLEAMHPPDNLEVELRGHMSHDAIARAYQGSHLCVFPTLADEWGMVVNESLSAGVPMVASIHAQASTELIRTGVNGWLYDPEQPGALGPVLDQALGTDAAARRTMSAAARASVKDWTPEAMADRMLEAMRSLLGESSTRLGRPLGITHRAKQATSLDSDN